MSLACLRKLVSRSKNVHGPIFRAAATCTPALPCVLPSTQVPRSEDPALLSSYSRWPFRWLRRAVPVPITVLLSPCEGCWAPLSCILVICDELEVIISAAEIAHVHGTEQGLEVTHPDHCHIHWIARLQVSISSGSLLWNSFFWEPEISSF